MNISQAKQLGQFALVQLGTVLNLLIKYFLSDLLKMDFLLVVLIISQGKEFQVLGSFVSGWDSVRAVLEGGM